jgi:hypothetical protein
MQLKRVNVITRWNIRFDTWFPKKAAIAAINNRT